MNQFEADERSATYRERLEVDFTTQVRSASGAYQTSQMTALIESLVDSAMGVVDALLYDELVTEVVPDEPFNVHATLAGVPDPYAGNPER